MKQRFGKGWERLLFLGRGTAAISAAFVLTVMVLDYGNVATANAASPVEPSPELGPRGALPTKQGTLRLSNGRVYVGDIRDGKPNGQGVMTYPDGQKYVGQFLDGLRQGQATVTFSDGRRFVGEYRDDKRNGHGVLTLPNGEKYVGEYRDGEKNGQGTSYFANSQIEASGLWANGKFVEATTTSALPPGINAPVATTSVAPPESPAAQPSPTAPLLPTTSRAFYREGRVLQRGLSGNLIAHGAVTACDILPLDAIGNPSKYVDLYLAKTFENAKPTLIELIVLNNLSNIPVKSRYHLDLRDLRIGDYIALEAIEGIMSKYGIPKISNWEEIDPNRAGFSLSQAGSGNACDVVFIDQATYLNPFKLDHGRNTFISQQDWSREWIGFTEIMRLQADDLHRAASEIFANLQTRYATYVANEKSLTQTGTQLYGMIGLTRNPNRPMTLAGSKICTTTTVDPDVATALVVQGEEAIGISQMPVWLTLPSLDAVFSEAKEGRCDAYFGKGADVAALLAALTRDHQYGVILPIFVTGEKLMSVTAQAQAERKALADATAAQQRREQAEYEAQQKATLAQREKERKEYEQEHERCLADAACKEAKRAQIIAVFSCSASGVSMPAWSCFIDHHGNGSLTIKNGEQTMAFTPQDFISRLSSMQAEIPLSTHFLITAQSSGNNVFVLNLIIRNGLDEQLYQNQATKYEVIKIEN